MAHSYPTIARRLPRILLAPTAVAIAAALAGCASSGSGAAQPSANPAATASSSSSLKPAPVTSQTPVSAEHNPPGDIPDTTVYVPYRSAAVHAIVKVPEGWARKQTATGASFSSNLNSITIAGAPMKVAPTVATVRGATVASLSRTSPAFRLKSIRAVTLAGGPAVEIIYQVNSSPNAVTGRQYRLVVERFEFYRAGRGAVLILSSAVGSDNVDPWRIVSESFRWG